MVKTPFLDIIFGSSPRPGILQFTWVIFSGKDGLSGTGLQFDSESGNIMESSGLEINRLQNQGEAGEEDRALRPARLADFIGQSELKEKLQVSITAARSREETLDHVLFSGPPGLGKTTLAAIIASEMEGRFHSTSAPALARPRDLAKILTILERNDILFIDEIHRLNRPCEEILYPAMEDGYIDFIVGEGVTAQSVQVPLPPFTLIGATTRTGILSQPLKARFGLDFKVEYYGIEEIALIISRTSRMFGLQLDEKAALVTASRSRMTPRVANRLVRRIRDYATVEGVKKITAPYAESCLERLGIDSRGLVDLDRRLLRIMIERYGGGPVGIKTLAALVDEEERTLEEDHEPYLLRQGLWEKTAQGRQVSPEAYSHLGYEEPSGAVGKRAKSELQQPDFFS